MEKLAGTFPDCVMVKQGFSFGLANASVQEYWCTNLGLHNQDQEVRLPTSPAPLKREVDPMAHGTGCAAVQPLRCTCCIPMVYL